MDGRRGTLHDNLIAFLHRPADVLGDLPARSNTHCHSGAILFSHLEPQR